MKNIHPFSTRPFEAWLQQNRPELLEEDYAPEALIYLGWAVYATWGTEHGSTHWCHDQYAPIWLDEDEAAKAENEDDLICSLEGAADSFWSECDFLLPAFAEWLQSEECDLTETGKAPLLASRYVPTA